MRALWERLKVLDYQLQTGLMPYLAVATLLVIVALMMMLGQMWADRA